jgi:hypothetical protein
VFRIVAIAAAAAAAGCTTGGFSGDPFPVHVDLTQGPILVQVAPAGQPPVTATLDVLAPFTLVDPGLGADVHREETTIDLYGQVTPGSADQVPRARFAVDLVSLHPCKDTDCKVGDPAAPTTVGAVLGYDALKGDALRLDFPNSDVYVLPSIGGDDEARSRQCDAVFQAPYRGGGTLVLGGAEVGFDGYRVALGACLDPDPENSDPLAIGTDALLVLSTGIGPTVIDTTAYQRYCLHHTCTSQGDLPPVTVLLPSGPIGGGLAQLPRIALVGLPATNGRGPCEDLSASYFLVEHDCTQVTCPCTSGQVCGAPAAVEVNTPVDVVVVADDEPVIQALRAELRPDQAEVDGILGTDALASVQLDLDYPDGRALARCGAGVDPAACSVRPALFSGSYKARVLACVGP